MVESVKDYAIYMLDPAGRVISWNAGAQRLQGYSVEEIMGQHFSRFYSGQQKSARQPENELMEAAAKGRFEEEGARFRKDGSQFWASVIINAVRNTQGELIGFSMVTRDITARKQAEQSIQKLNAELKQRADLLEVANKELESFSYSVSHDLRAPLRHIHGFVDLLQKNPALETDSSAQRYMGVIAKAAREMGILIDDLLAFSRTGRAEMHPVRIDMNQMVGQIIRDFAMDTEGRTVTWNVKPMSAAPGDPALIRLVWANLIGNAVKYTGPRPDAKIEVGQLTGDQDKSDGREFIYYVRDNGVGFDMQYAAKLFGVFQRLHRSEDFEGTGIGLANVQRIILRHGGRVWAEAKVGEGATFFFSLPVTTPPPV
jgi:PAS domain S-box-containing protein